MQTSFPQARGREEVHVALGHRICAGTPHVLDLHPAVDLRVVTEGI